MSAGTNKRQQPESRFLTVKETAAELAVSEKHIRRLIDRGELVAHRFGEAIRIKREDLDAYVATRRVFTVYNKD